MASKTPQKTERSSEIDLTDSAPEAGNQFQDLFDRWADSFALRLPDLFGNRLNELWGAGREMGGVIRIEESIDDEGITLKGELPGIDPEEDLEITVDNGRLQISAERRSSEKSEEGDTVRSEFRYGSYRRTLQLPAGADADAITATYDNGILEVRIPVERDQAGTARIPVTKPT